MKSSKISALENYGLTKSELYKLGGVLVKVFAYMDSYKLTPAVIRCEPKDRHEYLALRAKRWVRKLKQSWPTDSFEFNENRSIPTEIRSTLPANKIKNLENYTEIRLIRIESIKGLRRKRGKVKDLEWYCVKARVAIQIENQIKGLQTYEHRLVIVKAKDFDDAVERLKNQWKDYEKPYMNSDGYLVRWKLEEIEDVYSVSETEIDPCGTEVYSELKERRIRPEYAWKIN